MSKKTKKSIYQKRRKSFQKQMLPKSIAFFLAPKAATRSNDVEYPYRSSSDLYYLTGFAEPECVLVLRPKRSRIYLRSRNPEQELWEGYRLGVKKARSTLGVDEALPIDAFYNDLPELLKNRSALYYDFGQNGETDQRICLEAKRAFSSGRGSTSGPDRIFHPGKILWEMRLFKSQEEIQLLQRSAKATAEAHIRLMQKARPGLYAYELQAEILRSFQRHDATEAYPSIVAPGRHACVLHYTENSARLKKGELVLVDAGAELSYMATDVTRTFPTGKKFPPAKRDVYEIVLEAQKKAIRACRPGSTLEKVHEAALKTLIRGLIDLKLLKGNVSSFLEREQEQNKKQAKNQKKKKKYDTSKNSYKKYYMHKTSHWLGMDVHDVGAYYDTKGRPRRLKANMVFTVEPGLYIPKDDPKAHPELRGTGIRIEDDILITKDSYKNLTGKIPKEIQDIENLRKNAF